jgi:hypothetical protein
MPPTQGVFPVPYGTTPTHNPPGAVVSTSSSVASALVIGPGVAAGGGPLPPGGFPHQSSKSGRVPGVSGVLNGLPIDGGQEIYVPGIGHGLHAHGHGQQLGGPSSRHGVSFVFYSFHGGTYFLPCALRVCSFAHNRLVFVSLSFSHLRSDGGKSRSKRKKKERFFKA